MDFFEQQQNDRHHSHPEAPDQSAIDLDQWRAEIESFVNEIADELHQIERAFDPSAPCRFPDNLDSSSPNDFSSQNEMSLGSYEENTEGEQDEWDQQDALEESRDADQDKHALDSIYEENLNSESSKPVEATQQENESTDDRLASLRERLSRMQEDQSTE